MREVFPAIALNIVKQYAWVCYSAEKRRQENLKCESRYRLIAISLSTQNASYYYKYPKGYLILKFTIIFFRSDRFSGKLFWNL